jgi:two-component system sensor histidine kinase KdpD
VNATTAGFGYLVLVLLIASTWGFIEAFCASIAATLTFNFFFLPPFGTFTIADPQNWIALFSFLATSLVASRLSTKAKRRAVDAINRQKDLERLYTFSRAILLIDEGEPFARQLAAKLAEILELGAVVLYERASDRFFRSGPLDFDGLDEQLRDAALHGTTFSDAKGARIITAVRLGSEPIASLALQGARMPDSVLQGIANLVAIGLERSKARDLASQIEAARESEQLRTTLIDAMAHELKTPLTSIKAATTALAFEPDQPLQSRTELINIADEETERLLGLIDDAVEMARLDSADIEIHREPSRLSDLVHDVLASMQTGIDGRPFEVLGDGKEPPIPVDQRLLKLAIKQLIDNALKYSPPGTPVAIRVTDSDGMTSLEITDHGKGIPPNEQTRIFDRFYRSPSVKKQMPGSGLGLSIARSIARAHHGDLSVRSQPGETTFRLWLPGEHLRGEN